MTNGPRVSPFGTPSWAIESGPRRYWESGLGLGCWAIAMAAAPAANIAATRTMRGITVVSCMMSERIRQLQGLRAISYRDLDGSAGAVCVDDRECDLVADLMLGQQAGDISGTGELM